MTDAAPTVRYAARVVVVAPDDRVLLLRCRSGNNDGTHFWITPGGGLHEGETHEAAAIRELREEIGLDLASPDAPTALGRHIWSRTHTFPWLGRVLEQHERFYLCRLAGPIHVTRHEHTPDELNFLLGHRWWSSDDLARATDEQFAPRRLASLMHDLLVRGEPTTPIDVGV